MINKGESNSNDQQYINDGLLVLVSFFMSVFADLVKYDN